jgi:hypothetical protein
VSVSNFLDRLEFSHRQQSMAQNFLQRLVFETTGRIPGCFGAICGISEPIGMNEVSMNSECKGEGRGWCPVGPGDGTIGK